MRLKLDESLSRRLKPVLAGLGHDVATAEDEGLLARPDAEVAQAAIDEDRVLLTLDVEFADLRKHPPGTHPGVILFRPTTYGPRSVAEMVEAFVASADLTQFGRCNVVVGESGVRVRRP